jgi:uncharacterized SAM-binding protein YcdF (DUF218 family)
MDVLALYTKSLFSILNFLLFMPVLAWYLHRRGARRAAARVLKAAAILFLLFATPFLPRYLGARLENRFWPLRTDTLGKAFDSVYIHVLGSGYGLDDRLPATSQLAPVAKGRLMEGLRIHRALPNSVLICSAGSVMGHETQASVTAKAAILLGADSNRIIRLHKPNTTVEEANALKQQTGIRIRLILVTDAMHMPRAMDAFRKMGFNPMASPTNYKTIRTSNELSFKWGPSLSNLQLMDQVFHEFAGRIKMNLGF